MPNKTAHTISLRLLLFLMLGGFLVAQSPTSEFITPRAELGAFGGASWPRLQQSAPPATAIFVEGGLTGIKAAQNLSGRFAFEESFSIGVNNVLVPITSLNRTATLSSRTWEGFVGVLGYLTPPRSRFRPFLKVGPGGYWFEPKDPDRIIPTPRTQFQPALVTGAGFKIYFSRHFGVRVDGDASYMAQPHYKLPGAPSAPLNAFIPSRGTLWHFQATLGMFFGWGRVEQPAVLPPTAVTPPPAPTLTVEAAELRTIDAGCPGETVQPIDLSVSARTNLPGHQPSYRWTVNGAAAGENSPNFHFTVPKQSGQYRISVAVSDDASASTDQQSAQPVSKDVITVAVKDYQPPTISGSASPQQLNAGESATLTVTPHGGACNGQLTYICKADEGSTTGTPPTGYDSKGVAFDMSDRSRAQSKTVNISCTVTDAHAGTASTSIPVTVALPAVLTAQRFDDIIFPAGNSRVNNCGKRILLEEVYPLLTQHPDWDLVVVGYTAPNERARQGGKAIQLDRERVLNVVATLSAGADTCPKLELERIKVAFAGSDQKSEPRPAFCGASTRNKAAERPGQSVAENDPNAKFQRVAIYLVPKGAALPDGATSFQVVAASEVTPRGCPK